MHLQLATRTQAPAMVMVWTSIIADACSPLVFIDRGVKINAEYYREKEEPLLEQPVTVSLTV